MSADDIRVLLRRRPFEPFRVHVSGNRHYDIRQPEMVMVTPTATHIGILRDTSTDQYDAVDIVSNAHITLLEPIVPKKPSKKTSS